LIELKLGGQPFQQRRTNGRGRVGKGVSATSLEQL
jgi:hypothetical protein